jgi:probable F420-dependent oxidoreductase
MIELGRVGIWTRQLDTQEGAKAQDLACELEELGYQALWIPEAVEREVMSHATLLLSGTTRLVVATGVARIHARVAQSAALAQLLLTQRFPERFLLGLGVSHQLVVERSLGSTYGPPLGTMRAYLDAMDSTIARSTHGGVDARPPRILAALGPKMLALAAERSHGGHTYMATVEHTAWAREQLGKAPLLAVCMFVVVDTDATRARALARGRIAPAAALPAYRANIMRCGFQPEDFDNGLSDRLVDALVAHGDVADIADAVNAHLQAGANHVCIEVLTGDDTTVPLNAWRTLAPLNQP